MSEVKLKSPYMAVDCPACGAKAGRWCKRPSGHSGPMVAFHAARRAAADAAAVALTPEHPRWREFAGRLAGPEGCDFRERDDGEVRWKCAGGHDQTFARAILEKMAAAEPLDVAGTLAYCTANGGHCDCEIIFNVDPGTDEEE